VPYSRSLSCVVPRCVAVLSFVVAFTSARGQEAASATEAGPKTAASAAGQPADPAQKIEKRAFGIFPNYRSADASSPFRPVSVRQKFEMAAKDSFDWPLLLVSAGYAGLGQLTNQNPSLGQGAKGYANRYVRLYADLAMGNLLTEGAMPSLLAEDPRYFRRGKGRFWGRVGYATSRIFVTRTDSGGTRFNYSEVLGNSIAVGVSNAYYPDTRTVGDNLQKLTVQLANDAFSNVLKEFWPDAKRRLDKLHHGTTR
jgi:hypothetical protein